MAQSKRQRLSADETRERLIQAGFDSLARTGLSVGLDAVTLDQAVRDSGVPRSSAYGIWSEDDDLSPQEHFQRAVLQRVVGKRVVANRVFHERMTKVYDEHAETMTRAQLVREIIRVVAGDHVDEIEKIVEWRISIALRAILLSAPEDARNQVVLKWLQASEKASRNQTIDMLLRPSMELLGFTPRPEYGDAAYEYIEAAASSITEGLASRVALNADSVPGGGLQHPEDGSSGWSIYSLVFERMLDVFFMSADEGPAKNKVTS